MVLSEENLHYYNPEGGYDEISYLSVGVDENIDVGIARIPTTYSSCKPLDEAAHTALIRKAIRYPEGISLSGYW